MGRRPGHRMVVFDKGRLYMWKSDFAFERPTIVRPDRIKRVPTVTTYRLHEVMAKGQGFAYGAGTDSGS